MNPLTNHSTPLELWGGIECTVNRVGDQYHDQLEETGHAHRLNDLEQFAELGLTSLRYPVLWERTAANGIRNADWSWADERLHRLRMLGIAPIVGLVHHGSGPKWTSLLDESFITGLSEYAGAIAQRFPWIETFTPVNEPLTTARFSGLYGHWYPHARSDEAFATALIVQCLATVESMRRIRSANSDAKFLLTEDLAKIHSTPLLAGQARFENLRRWLSIDLLMGHVDAHHELWSYLARNRRLIDWLKQLVDEPMPPDLLGFNYYLTSERLLDERVERYPAWSHGGNAHQRYADIEAVRVRAEGIDGVHRLLGEAWQRYRLPMAITEVHLSGECVDQIRWVLDTWRDAQSLRSQGVDLRAVTLWSLLGCFDWNTLCACKSGHYEPGVFDVRSGAPRSTDLAKVVVQLANGEQPNLERIPDQGWWRTEHRLAYPPVATTEHPLSVDIGLSDYLPVEDVIDVR